MSIGAVFSGNALRTVNGDGRTTLPSFVVETLERRGAGARILFGVHESEPCISGYDEAYQAILHEDEEERRLREEARGLSAHAHHSRARRIFGGVERGLFGESGEVTLPPMVRRRARIGARALFVGTGGSFEIWDPDTALAAGGELRELAELVLQAAEEER